MTLLPDKELLRRLVSFDSTSARSNAPIADFVCEYLERSGVNLARITAGGGAKINVVARREPEGAAGEARGGLVLSGHLDTVPAKETGWTSDPFTLTETADTYVGRGTCDMKGSIAVMMNVFASIDPRQLRRPLVLLLTCDEELGSLGARRVASQSANQAPWPQSCLVAEPTSLQAVRMHKGHLKVHLVILGKAAHSGTPQRGVNAIEAAGRVLAQLAPLKAQLEQERLPSSRYFPEVPYVALNVAKIAGGDAVNVVPDRCTLDLGVRTLPGADSDSLVDRIRGAVEKASCGESGFKLEVVNDSPPMMLDEHADIYRRACAMLGQWEDHTVSFSTDAGVLSQAMGMECVILGPGSMDAAHRANEFVPISEFNRAAPLFTRVVKETCCDETT